MPTTTNPFQDDPSDPFLAEVFEQGIIAGFNDPDESDFRPLPPDLLEVFQQGFQVGREDKSAPPGPAVVEWMTMEDIANVKEGVEEAEVLALTLLLDHIFETAEFSCVEVVRLALDPAGDTQLQPLPPGFRAGFNVEDTDPAVHFIAVCPRSDHAQVSPGVTSDGHWTGQDRSSFLDAVGDMTAHEHSEAFVARCDLSDNTCGPVWLAAKRRKKNTSVDTFDSLSRWHEMWASTMTWSKDHLSHLQQSRARSRPSKRLPARGFNHTS